MKRNILPPALEWRGWFWTRWRYV